jgi:virginiamycin A acetyltransferase
MKMPDPNRVNPITLPDGTEHLGTVHLDQVIDHPRIEVGAFTYASANEPPEDWATRLAPYLLPFAKQKLVIGKYGQIADGVTFLAASNHDMDGFTTYPFPIFDPETIMTYQPDNRDTIIGHDVWLANGATILPGAKIGNGVIVGARSVVRGVVEDYSVVIGNPATVVRKRFDPITIARLQKLAWWDWPAEKVASARVALTTGDLDALEAM